MSANLGTTWETELELICEHYKARGLAKIHKIDPPIKVLARVKGGLSRVIFLENPFLDFGGTWTARRGRCLFFEAKFTSEPKLAICAKGGSGMSHDQLDALIEWHDAGALAFLLWMHGGECRILTVSMIRARLAETGRKSLRWIDAFRVPRGTGYCTWDFLACLESLDRDESAPMVHRHE